MEEELIKHLFNHYVLFFINISYFSYPYHTTTYKTNFKEFVEVISVKLKLIKFKAIKFKAIKLISIKIIPVKPQFYQESFRQLVILFY